MLSWERYWPRSMGQDMKETVLGGRRIYVYEQMKQSLYHALAATADRRPGKIAIVDDSGSKVSYSRLLELTDRLAETLTVRYQVRKGDHVGLLLYNGLEFCVSYLALSKVGAVTVSLPGKYQKPELLSLVEKADIGMIICQERFEAWFAGDDRLKLLVCRDEKSGADRDDGTIFHDIECVLDRDSGFDASYSEPGGRSPEPCGTWEDPAVFMFTSGTTSMSKAVVMKNYHIMNSVESYIRTLKLTGDDVTLIATPMYHVTGMICILSVFIAVGGTVHIMKKVDSDRVLRCFIEQNVTFYHASPTVFSMLLGKNQDYPSIPSMRGFACGSGNMPPENIRKLKAWMPDADFHTVYGLTETTGAGTIFPEGAADSPWIGSSGVPMPGLQVKIIGEEGAELAENQVGEVCLRGSFLLEHYYKTETGTITDEGWLMTGDLGYYNEAGYLYIVDRKKDMINRGGEKICSFDIENEICTLPGVAEAAVVGVPDAKYMEVPAAVIRLEAAAVLTEAMIKSLLSERIARFKIPEYVIFADEIPKNHNGKVDKNRLKERLKSEGVIWEQGH